MELLGKEQRSECKTFSVIYEPLVPHHIQWCVRADALITKMMHEA